MNLLLKTLFFSVLIALSPIYLLGRLIGVVSGESRPRFRRCPGLVGASAIHRSAVRSAGRSHPPRGSAGNARPADALRAGSLGHRLLLGRIAGSAAYSPPGRSRLGPPPGGGRAEGTGSVRPTCCRVSQRPSRRSSERGCTGRADASPNRTETRRTAGHHHNRAGLRRLVSAAARRVHRRKTRGAGRSLATRLVLGSAGRASCPGTARK